MSLRTITVLFLLAAQAVSAAGLTIESGQRYYLHGFLQKRGSDETPEYWLLTGTRGAKPGTGGEVRLVDGAYPRSVRSIYGEYEEWFPLVVSGTGTAEGAVALDLMEPGFRPAVPAPQPVDSIKLEGTVLTITARINPCIEPEELLLRFGVIFDTYPRSTGLWVEVPDPYATVCSGDDVPRTFQVDLRQKFGDGPIYIHVMNGRCGEGHTLLWGQVDRPAAPALTPAAWFEKNRLAGPAPR